MSTHSFDTIAAIATPPGLGGIAVLRISGPGALAALQKLFVPPRFTKGRLVPPVCPAPGDAVGTSGESLAASGAVPAVSGDPLVGSGADFTAPVIPFVFQPRHMHFGYALDPTGGRIDEVLAVYMPGPHSATGEDVGEIHCHGGAGVSTAILESAFVAGARLAQPGEFTRRAFLNGRMDLTQAEAVAELIAAPAAQGARLAQAKLEGAMGDIVGRIKHLLESCRIQLTLAVDFPDEDAELLTPPSFIAAVTDARREITALLAAFDRARLWREGASAVLAGKVNAGKSSLLNALLGRRRAIVSPQPGTTRDYIEESLLLDGLPLRLIDTAGLRDSADRVEAEGMRLSQELASEADLILLVVDVLTGVGREERDFLTRHADRLRQGNLLIVLNKIDEEDTGEGITDQTATEEKSGSGGSKVDKEDKAEGAKRETSEGAKTKSGAPEGARKGDAATAPQPIGGAAPLLHCDIAAELDALGIAGRPVFRVSAKTGEGIDALAQGIRAALLEDASASKGSSATREVSACGDVAPNVRQSTLLRQADTELSALTADLEAGMPPDILSVRLDSAAALLDEVVGNVDNEAILDAIFSSFCIGK